MPGIETNDFEPEIAEFMHQPWRHRSGLDPYAGVIPRMPADQNGDLFWNRGALTPPKSVAGSANHRASPPGSRHYRRIRRRPRLSDVHICLTGADAGQSSRSGGLYSPFRVALKGTPRRSQKFVVSFLYHS